MSKANILVSGATGRTGGGAADELLKLGKRVRAYVRPEDERAAALRQRGVEIARSAISLASPTSGRPWRASVRPYLAQEAKEAGVNAIVNMSQ